MRWMVEVAAGCGLRAARLELRRGGSYRGRERGCLGVRLRSRRIIKQLEMRSDGRRALCSAAGARYEARDA